MSGYGIEPEPVYGSGTNIHGLGDDAHAAASGVLKTLDEAQGTVHHPVVAGALGAYRDRHSKDANSLMFSVQDCGSKIATTANITVDGENEQTAAHTVTANQAEQTSSALNRPL